MLNGNIAGLLYLVSGILFILALRGLSAPETARHGNRFGVIGMGIAAATTFLYQLPWGFSSFLWIVLAIAIGGYIGVWRARTIQMTAMPQLVALFHALIGLAAVLVPASALYALQGFGLGVPGGIRGTTLFEMSLGAAIGAMTFTGSVIAFLKLDGRMTGSPILLANRHAINIGLGILLAIFIFAFIPTETHQVFWLIVLVSFALGVLLIVPIGGADMPVVISMLNSYSGWAAAAVGFTLANLALIITGALVGSSGAILSYIMCRGMNRSFISVILGGFGGEIAVRTGSGEAETRPVKQGSAEDAAKMLLAAKKVIIVPGYGMAVAQAQHAVGEMADFLKSKGVDVKYAIHPVAGRMPGHMNVLLAEADVSYDNLLEMEQANEEFPSTDVVLVLGANDVVNPAAKSDPSSPIYGMPILEVELAKTCIVNKRSMKPGY